MFDKNGIRVKDEEGYAYESSDEESDYFDDSDDEPALLKELRRGSASQVLESNTPKDMRKPTISYWMNKIDEMLGDDESEMSFDDLLNGQGFTQEQKMSIKSIRQSMRMSGAVLDVKQMDEMQNLYSQLEVLRQDVKEEEKKQVEVESKQQETMTKIKRLFLEAEKTSQEFKDIPTSVQVSQNENE